MICIVHYDHSCDVDIRPLSESQYDTIVQATSVRQAQEGEGHRLDSTCHNIPTFFDRTFMVLIVGASKTLPMYHAYAAEVSPLIHHLLHLSPALVVVDHRALMYCMQCNVMYCCTFPSRPVPVLWKWKKVQKRQSNR